MKPNTPSESVSLKTWIALFAVILGAFMAILDIQITNSSLKEIQGALSATLEEGSWISTSYLAAEIIVIPLTAWLVRVFSLRLYLFVNAFLFIVFSLCCAWAWDLPSMILFRGLQGFTGGVLIPTAFNTILTILPKSKQPIGMVLFTMTATCAPAIGPAFGGWLTDAYGWQYIFYLNLLPALFLLPAVWWAIDPKPLQPDLLKRGDWLGVITMAIGLGTLVVVLEEGNRKDWFSSDFITRLALISGLCLAVFFYNEWTRKEPLVNLRLFQNRNFAIITFINVMLGIGLYGSIYLLPLYLAQIQGYNAMQIGSVLIFFGLPQLFIIPLVPKVMKWVDIRVMLAIGVCFFATSCFLNTDLNLNVSGDQLRFTQFIRALGPPFIFTPLAMMLSASIPSPQENGSASALFNMMRNLGGSVGFAILSTILTRREHLHSNMLGQSVTLYSPATQERLHQLSSLFVQRGADLYTANQEALKILNLTVQREAYLMAFSDCFFLIGIGLLLGGASIVLLKKVHPPQAGAGEGAAH